MDRMLRAATLAALLVAAAPGHAGTPAAEASHHYVYYPKHQIYFAPEQQMWYWRDGASWSSGAALPVVYQQYTRGGYHVYVDAERPYEAQHAVDEGLRRQRWAPYRYGENQGRGHGASAPGHGGRQ